MCYVFFLLQVILYVRLDLTLSKDDATEAKMRVSSHCEQVHTHHEKRARLYEKLEEEIQKLKSSKDVAHSQVMKCWTYLFILSCVSFITFKNLYLL